MITKWHLREGAAYPSVAQFSTIYKIVQVKNKIQEDD